MNTVKQFNQNVSLANEMRGLGYSWQRIALELGLGDQQIYRVKKKIKAKQFVDSFGPTEIIPDIEKKLILKSCNELIDRVKKQEKLTASNITSLIDLQKFKLEVLARISSENGGSGDSPRSSRLDRLGKLREQKEKQDANS